MKLSRRELLAAGAASVMTGTRVRGGSRAETARRQVARMPGPARHPPNLPIREYPSLEARRITDNALDGLTTAAELESPPATQNAASQADGRGPAIEMLNCLRYTDLPQVAGLLYPAEIVLSGDVPAAYAWAEDLYRRLGTPGSFHTPS